MAGLGSIYTLEFYNYLSQFLLENALYWSGKIVSGVSLILTYCVMYLSVCNWCLTGLWVFRNLGTDHGLDPDLAYAYIHWFLVWAFCTEGHWCHFSEHLGDPLLHASLRVSCQPRKQCAFYFSLSKRKADLRVFSDESQPEYFGHKQTIMRDFMLGTVLVCIAYKVNSNCSTLVFLISFSIMCNFLSVDNFLPWTSEGSSRQRRGWWLCF